jgi:hypothetical protein
VDVQRFGGADRIETAVAVSQGLYPVPDSAGAVVLARAGDFADALAGTPLAHARNAPTLLTGGDELDPRTAAEIDRLLAGRGTVHVLGGEAAIGPGVVDALTDGGYDVERVAGADRFETSVAVAEALGNPDSVLLARGGDFPDAVTAGAAAAHTDGAVLLTTGDEPHPAAAAYLDEHEPAETFAVGGPAVRAHPDAAAVSGPHRWGTAREVAETFFSEPSFAGIARGDAFPDALTGGVLSGGSGGPVLLTLPAALPDDTAAYLCANASSLSFAGGFGGPAAISDEVLGEVRARIDGQGC